MANVPELLLDEPATPQISSFMTTPPFSLPRADRAMAISPQPAALESPDTEEDLCAERARQLPSGRSVLVKVTPECEELEIRDAEGQVEVCVILTGAGPVVRIRGGRLELDAADTVALRCRRFD